MQNSQENLITHIQEILKTFDQKYLTAEGDFILSKIREDIENFDESLISALMTDELISQSLTKKIGDMTVFDVKKLTELLNYESYWQGSYTKYANKIGLTVGGKYLDENLDVVLDFPYKDTVLTANMSKESEKLKELRDEPFLNEVIAKSEIDVLLDKKILINAVKYDAEHLEGEKVTKFDEKTDNLIIKGNNLLALHSLKEKYAGKVKLIYLDPPYNTGNDSFLYNDRFNHSTWLTFMKNRLEVARDLLSKDGSIWINFDENEDGYLKVLMNDIFGRENFVANIIWNHTKQSKNDERHFSRHYNNLIVFAKNKTKLKNFTKPRTEKDNINYKNPDNDPKGLWRAGDVRSPNLRETLKFDIIAPNGNIIKAPEKGWRWSEQSVKEKIAKGEIVFKKDNSGIIRKIYLANQEGRMPENIWFSEEAGSTREANSEIKALFGESVFSTPKPEKLLKSVIEIASEVGDIVLDYHMGSATTQAVAMKMKRGFIGIEQMDYINTVSVERLKKVIVGEQGGISKAVNWKGGGSFVYAELMEKNTGFIREIADAITVSQLQAIFNRMKVRGDIDFRVNEKLLSDNLSTWENDLGDKLDFGDIQKLLIRVIDKNQLYYNFSEMDDEKVKDLLSEEDVKFNQNFYEE
ncbi:hypothetical protein LLWA12L8_FAMOGCFE_00814 [Lactococcus lactis]|uniref:DNA methyltransferase n=1 Tax=Lactococcus lactis TaxID=1358 RepID=UPI00384BE7C3